VFAQTIELTLNETVGLSKIIIGPAVRKVLPHEVLIVRETYTPLGQLKRVKCVEQENSVMRQDLKHYNTPNFLAAIVNN
jgi:hypothetical protein